MFKVMILICHISLAPAECQIGLTYDEGLRDVIVGPDATNEVTCAMHGQAYVAETALGTRERDDEYVKIKCTRSSIGKSNVG